MNASSRAGKPANILIADDIRANLTVLQKLLQRAGYSVHVAENGKQAMEILRSEPIDLIISDILMPVMDGYQLCRQCQHDKALCHIPFIFYTATYTSDDDRAFGLSLGAARFIIKPAEHSAFLREIAEVLGAFEANKLPATAATPERAEKDYLREHSIRLVNKLEHKLKQVQHEIGERKQAEETLRESNARLTNIFETMSDGFVAFDANMNYTYVNAHASEMLGRNPADLIGKNYWLEYPEAKGTPFAKAYKQALETQATIIFEDYYAPFERWFENRIYPFKDGLSVLFTDTTERKQQQAQLRLLESAVTSINESIVITNPDGVIVYVNPAFTPNTGFTAEEAIGKTPAILNSKQQSTGFYNHFWQTIKGGQPWSGRILDRKKDGTIVPVHLSVAPIFNEHDEITHFVAVHEDLTELESLQKQMIQSQKMESVGIMAGGIAHDFNNLLAGLVGNLYLMRTHHKENAEIATRTREMEIAIQHGAKMIQQMLVFARKDRPAMHDMDLRAFMKEAQRLAEASLPENISFSFSYPGKEAPWIHGDSTQLQQIILNLVGNARHAVSGVAAPRIKLELCQAEPSPELLTSHADLRSDTGWCCIRCTDNGCGMTQETQEHIFDPFFTTREVGDGTGLGLAMVYGAISNHRGIIDVQSTEGRGSVFSIYLPQHHASEVQLVGSADVQIDGHGKGILVVDDADSLREVLAEVLQQSGFTIWEACDGEQAIAAYKAYGQKIDLVLMDVVMPNKGGLAAAADIRAMDADVPIIFQTGYGEQTQLDAAQAIAHSESLQKPVKIPELLEILARKIGNK